MKAIMPTQQALDHVRSWYLNSILLRPADIGPEVTIDVLTLDDDDNDIFNGTPHYQQIAQGFNAKGLTAPPIDWVKITPQNLPGEFATDNQGSAKIARFVFTAGNNAGTLNPDSFRFHYKLAGGTWQSVPVINQQGIYRWAHRAGGGTSLLWYVSAQDTQGRTSTYPRAGAAGALSLTYGSSS